MDDSHTLIVHIDGSALTNPGHLVGCAGVVHYPDHLEEPDVELTWSYDIGSSGSMELHALVNAYVWINKNYNHLSEFGIQSAIIYSDNQLVVDGANVNIYKWAKGWKKTSGGSLQNVGAWKKYATEKRRARIRIYTKKIAGKTTPPTRAVDQLAKQSARSMPTRTDSKFRSWHIGRSLTGSKFPIETIVATGQEIEVRVYGHRAVNHTKSSEYEVRFEQIHNGEVVGRFRVFANKEIDSKLDRHHFYRIRLDSNRALPMIVKAGEIESPLAVSDGGPKQSGPAGA